MDDDGQRKVTALGQADEAEPSAESRRAAARRRFLKQGATAGSGLVIYTIHHQRSFAGGSTTTVYVSSVAACASVGGFNAKLTKVVDSINPVPSKDSKGNLVYQNGKLVYDETKEAMSCEKW